jgi:hypothetical protein
MRNFAAGIALFLSLVVSDHAGASTVVDIGSDTFSIPQNGVVILSNPSSAPFTGSFDIIGNPTFSGSGFAILTMNANVNGANYSVETELGTCPVGNCGSFPYVTDNVYGSHLGPGGYSTFLVSNSENPALDVSSSWSLQLLSGNIAITPDYQVQINVSLPASVAAVPELSTWAMLVLGFLCIGATAYRKSQLLRSVEA